MKFKTISAIAATLLLTAFSKFAPPETDIIGKWKIDEASVNKAAQRVIGKLKLTNLNLADKIESQRKAVKEQIAAVRVTFNADHTTSIQSGDKTIAGSWNFSNNYHTLSTAKNGVTRKDSILSLSASRMELVGVAEHDTVVYTRP